MKLNRELVTPYLGAIFIIVALSGILMFFHLLDDYTAFVHEFLGLTFVFLAVLHVLTNRKSVGHYNRKKKLLLPALIVLFAAGSLIVIGKMKGNLERELLERMVKAPVVSSFKTLNIDYDQAHTILQQHNITVGDSLQSIEEISRKNNKSPEEIIELILTFENR